jgi:hypothetical protein
VVRRFNLNSSRLVIATAEESQNVSCLCPHSLHANFTRVAPFSAETRFGAPHFPQVVWMRVLPCFTTMALRAMVSRIRRSASSRIDCFDIRCTGDENRSHLIALTSRLDSTDIASCDQPVAKKLLLKPASLHRCSNSSSFVARFQLKLHLQQTV